MTEIINWLTHNRKRLSFRAIEAELGIPDTTLNKAVRGQQALSKKWVQPLEKLKEDMSN